MSNRLHCFYDLSVSPCSFDFFQFLVLSEIQRKREGFRDIELIFVFGPNNGYRQDNIRSYEQNDQQFKNVILPGCQLLSSIKTIRLVDERKSINTKNMDPHSIFPRGYQINNPVSNYMYNGIVCSHFLNEKFVQFKAPSYAISSIGSYLNKFDKNKKILVLSTRELIREDASQSRTMRYDVWEKFFLNLNRDEWQPIIIRDTETAFSNDKLFKDIPEADFASQHLHLRYALYEASTVNIFKSNGPAALTLLGSEKPMIMFLKFDNNVCAMSEDWFKNNLGMCQGSQFPLSRKNKIVVWGEETEDLINKSIQISENSSHLENNLKPHDYINIKNLIYVIQVSLGYTLRNMQYGIWKEDIDFFDLYDDLIKKNIINAQKSFQIISELEGNQLPMGIKKNFLNVRENYSNFKSSKKSYIQEENSKFG